MRLGSSGSRYGPVAGCSERDWVQVALGAVPWRAVLNSTGFKRLSVRSGGGLF
jgi:hypothetical protein